MLRRVLAPAAFLTAIWWTLTGTLVEGLVAGAVGVAFGLALFRFMGGGGRSAFRPLGLFAFLPYIAWQSVRGGWDVSRRALWPTMPLNPTVLHLELSLPSDSARIFLTNALSLMPGTVGADLRGQTLVVHLLAAGPGSEAQVRALETRVGRLFRSPAR